MCQPRSMWRTNSRLVKTDMNVQTSLKDLYVVRLALRRSAQARADIIGRANKGKGSRSGEPRLISKKSWPSNRTTDIYRIKLRSAL